MSRLIGTAGDLIVTAQYAAINDLDTFTVASWIYWTGGGYSTGRWYKKDGAMEAQKDGTNLRWEAFRWDGQLGRWVITRPANNEWHHTAVTYDYSSTNNHPTIYVDAVDASATRQVKPKGTPAAETGEFIIGNQADGYREAGARFAETAIWNRILSVGEIYSVAYRGPVSVSSGLVLYEPVWGSMSPEPNYAGPNNGIVTATTQADHAPCGPPFGFASAYEFGAVAAPSVFIRDMLRGPSIIPFAR